MRIRFKCRLAGLLCLLLLLTTSTTGCVPWAKGIRSIDESVTDWRDFVWGKRAFYQRYGSDASGPFMDGFLEGYHDMLQGDDGCVPVVPPRKYWGWKYQSAGGQSSISDWFDGYAAGVTAAKEDGLADLGKVPVSSSYNGSSKVPIRPSNQIVPPPEIIPLREQVPVPGTIIPQAPQIENLIPGKETRVLPKNSSSRTVSYSNRWQPRPVNKTTQYDDPRNAPAMTAQESRSNPESKPSSEMSEAQQIEVEFNLDRKAMVPVFLKPIERVEPGEKQSTINQNQNPSIEDIDLLVIEKESNVSEVKAASKPAAQVESKDRTEDNSKVEPAASPVATRPAALPPIIPIDAKTP